MVRVGLPAQGVLLDMMAKEQFPQPLLQDFADHYCDGQLPDLKPPKQAEKDQDKHKKSPRSSVQLRRLHWLRRLCELQETLPVADREADLWCGWQSIL